MPKGTQLEPQPLAITVTMCNIAHTGIKEKIYKVISTTKLKKKFVNWCSNFENTIIFSR